MRRSRIGFPPWAPVPLARTSGYSSTTPPELATSSVLIFAASNSFAEVIMRSTDDAAEEVDRLIVAFLGQEVRSQHAPRGVVRPKPQGAESGIGGRRSTEAREP
jgi:hypothetical protein